MDWLQIGDYMIVVEKDKTMQLYRNLNCEQNEDYVLFMEYCSEDAPFVEFLKQFGVEHTKPYSLQATTVEQGAAILFTGKFYFEGYLELGEYDLWDIVIGDAVFSFTNEEVAPFLVGNTSFVEVSFELVKASRVKL